MDIHYKPWRILSIYQSEKSSDSYLEVAKMYPNGKIGAFSPLSSQMVTAIAKVLKTSNFNVPHGLIPPNLVYYNPSPFKIQWRCELKKAHLYYKKDLNIKDGIRPIPNLLFTYTNDNLNVRAYIKWNGIKTKFYHAPFHNIYINGGICMGRTNLKYVNSDTIETYINRLQTLFFLIPGSEIHYSYGNVNINSLHIELLDKTSFENKILIPFNNKK